jgi:cytochrome c
MARLKTCMRSRARARFFASLAWSAALATAAFADDRFGFGQPVATLDVAAWNVDVAPSGSLPAGQGSVADGLRVYASTCAQCHGSNGQGGPMDRLVGGSGTLNTATPVKTIGSYWPYATTIFDYIRRAMPFDRPGTLTNDQVYAVTAYLLNQNGIVAPGAVMNARTLKGVVMPNHARFIEHDPRPDAP